MRLGFLFLLVTLAAAPASSTRPSGSAEPLGGKDAESRLAGLIRRTCLPSTRPVASAPAAKPPVELPAEFPPFGREGFMGGNMSGLESQVTQLAIANHELATKLDRYESSSVLHELERRLAAESEERMSLYLAALAAPRGSQAGALRILEAMKSADYRTVRNAHGAIQLALGGFQADPPDWLVEVALAALADQRDVTGLEAIKTDPSGAVANQAITVLSVFKYKAAVEGLIACFDASYDGKSDWKRAYTAEMFRANIAESFQKITGQHLGPDQRQWLQWWRDDGSKRSDLEQ